MEPKPGEWVVLTEVPPGKIECGWKGATEAAWLNGNNLKKEEIMKKKEK
jgi:hypothetical protein